MSGGRLVLVLGLGLTLCYGLPAEEGNPEQDCSPVPPGESRPILPLNLMESRVWVT